MAQPRCAVEKELATDEAESHVVRHNNFFSDRLLGDVLLSLGANRLRKEHKAAHDRRPGTGF